jgi:hypothetical protein
VRLIDKSLAFVDDLGLYRLAEPVEDAVRREFGGLSAAEYALVANATREYITTLEKGAPRLELSRMLFRAASISGDTEVSRDVLHLVE